MSRYRKNPNRKLFLDDVRRPPVGGWDVVRSYTEFVAYLAQYGMPDLISFDHDLAPEHYAWPFTGATEPPPFVEKTGYDCAMYIVENRLPLQEFRVHSANPAGRERIRQLLRAYKAGIMPVKIEGTCAE